MHPFTSPRYQARVCTVLNDGSDDSRSPDDLLTTKGFAEQYSFSPATIRNWRWKRQGPPFIRAQGKAIRYRRADIDAWLQAQRVEPK